MKYILVVQKLVIFQGCQVNEYLNIQKQLLQTGVYGNENLPVPLKWQCTRVLTFTSFCQMRLETQQMRIGTVDGKCKAIILHFKEKRS